MTKLPVSLLLVAVLAACSEPRPSGTGGNAGSGTSAGNGSGGTSAGSSTGGGSTGASTTGGASTSGTGGTMCTAGSCGNYICIPGAGCPAFCSDDSVCISGHHCFLPQRACCPALVPGAPLYVDGSIGADTGCCGSGPGSAACRTLGVAMGEIEKSGAHGVILSATVNGGGGDWTAPESWPVTLHLGVTLVAPGVHFFVPDSPSSYLDIFDLKPFDANDNQPVTIRGTPASPTFIGFDSNAGQYMNANNDLFVAGLKLQLGSVWLGGGNDAVQVSDLGILEIDGKVQIGNFQNTSHSITVPGTNGIACGGSGAASVATVTDPGAADGDLTIQGQGTVDLLVSSFCIVNLQHAPLFGVAPVSGRCTADPKLDNFGVSVQGDPAQVTMNNPTFQCMYGDGVQISSGAGVVTLNAPTITNCGCSGLSTLSGTIYSNAGKIEHNHTGVLQTDGQIILSGGGTGGIAGGNTIGCDTQNEPGYCFGDGYPGVDVENDSTNLLDADNCFFDHVPPSVITCLDPSLTSCSCVTGPCATNFDGIDVAAANTGLTTFHNAAGNNSGCN